MKMILQWTILPCLAFFPWSLPLNSVEANERPSSLPLLEATYADDTKEAKALLESGADPDAINRYGVTPLALACQNGNVTLVESLLAAGADPDKTINGDETPLLIAARTGLPEPVTALLASGAKVDAPNRASQTPLMWAANEGHTETVRLLIEAGADVNAQGKSGLTPLLLAARNGHIGVAEEMLKAGVAIDYAIQVGQANGKAPPKGTTALRVAVENAHFDLAVVLLDAGADANDQRSGDSALHVLSWVRKPNRGDGDDGMPAPHGSGQLSSLEFARLLVEKYHADPDIRLRDGASGGPKFGTRGATPFLFACRTADIDYLKLLAQLGADTGITNDDGTTALMAAAGVGSSAPEEEAGTEDEALPVVLWLLDNGADANAKNKNGESAMHGAAYRNRPKLVALLAQHDADIGQWNQPNKHGWTPLLIARGYRPGNFKPSVPTEDAIKQAMLDAGVEIPAHPPLPTTDKPKKYQP